jgi:hypothetical protein
MYTIRQFARLADVTVKALRHYERVNLLVLARSAARHRRYHLADLPRLERVLALRTLGLPARPYARSSMGTQRLLARLAVLEDLCAPVDRAIEALRVIEQHPRPSEALDAFVHEAAWSRSKRLGQARASAPAGPRTGLARRAWRSFGPSPPRAEDPDSPDVRPLVRQWHDTMTPEIRESVRGRTNWPSPLRAYVASPYDTAA